MSEEETPAGNLVRLVHSAPIAAADDDECGLVVEYRPRKCVHASFVVDTQSRVVECGKCGEKVDPFEALLSVAQTGSQFKSWYRSKRDELEKLQSYQPHLKAVRSLEGVWRGKMLPCCPHCGKGIEAAELAHGSQINRAIATRLREVEQGRHSGELSQPHPLDESSPQRHD